MSHTCTPVQLWRYRKQNVSIGLRQQWYECWASHWTQKSSIIMPCKRGLQQVCRAHDRCNCMGTPYKLNSEKQREWWWPGVRVGRNGRCWPKVRTCGYQISKFWRSHAQDSNYSQPRCVIYPKVAKRLDLKCSHYKKEMINTGHDRGVS